MQQPDHRGTDSEKEPEADRWYGVQRGLPSPDGKMGEGVEGWVLPLHGGMVREGGEENMVAHRWQMVGGSSEADSLDVAVAEGPSMGIRSSGCVPRW